MTGRERFRLTMRYGAPDRVPYFDDGIREEVLKAWQKQGLDRMFSFDRREEAWPDHEHPRASLRKVLSPLKQPDCIRMLRVHRGFFLSMGVGDWRRFMDVNFMLYDHPKQVHKILSDQAEFSVRLVQQALSEIELDAAVFSEPIGGNGGPLVSPRMYEEFALKSYVPILDVLRQFKVETIILRTYSNVRPLLPRMLAHGFNCLWLSEAEHPDMDYLRLRREFGRDLRLIGGISLNALRKSKDAVKREMEEKVLPLLQEGGYVPLAGGRVREDVPFENYVYYRRLLEGLAGR